MAAEAVVTAIAEETVQSCFQVIGQYINYTRKYKKNIERLKLELQKLQDNSSAVKNKVRIAENNAEDIMPNVQGWLQTSDEISIKVNELFENSKPFHTSCLCCSFPNLNSRYSASSEALELTSSITQHLQDGNFDKVGQQPKLDQLPLLSPGEFHVLESRKGIIEQVMDGLKNDSISLISLCGMGGVGKTTLVKEIGEEVKKEKLFDEVAFVVVSQDANVKAIQDKLASRLGLDAMENKVDIQERAELLYKRLMNKNNKILVILDDIWQELNLRSIGIPVHGDRKGFKILFTSRFDRVCANMKVQKRLQIGILSKDEAWDLFNITAEISDDSILGIAEEVSLECAGLPLAIVIVGKSLRNKKEPSFRHVLRTLRDPSRSYDDGIYSCIKLSYDYLESDDHRLILVLCSIFPEDYEIQVEELIRYSRGLLDTFESMAAARDRVEDIIDELIKCHLILPGETEKCVKLHDVVRDVCISIASKTDDVHMLVQFNDLQKKLSGLKSQRLRLLRLVDDRIFKKNNVFIQNVWLKDAENKEMNIYEEMQELRVLEVNDITTSLPSSLPFMTNLQTLSFDYCRLKGDCAGIGSLKMLRVLTFFHSILEMFPTEIAKLSNLQCLDLRFRLEHPNSLPIGTLSSFDELEELYLGDNILGNIESLKELCSSPKLHTIQFMGDNVEVLLKDSNLSKLKRFDITNKSAALEYQIRENVLHLRGKNVDMDLYPVKELMCSVKSFEFNGKRLPNAIDFLLEGKGFQNLKKLNLDNCDMKYLVDATKYVAKGVSCKLEKLDISTASQLEELIHGEHQFGTLSGGLQEVNQGNLNGRGPFLCPFGNLKTIFIQKCDRLKSLFTNSMVNYLSNLNQMLLYECSILERIVTNKNHRQVDGLEVSQFQFRTLRQLTLHELPEFRIFGPQSDLMADLNQVMLPELVAMTLILCDSIKEKGGEGGKQQELCFYLGSLPKVQYMEISECNNLFNIAKSELLHGFQDLQKLSVKKCLSVEVVFDFEEMTSLTSAETEEITILGRLEVMDLVSLPRLKHIWRMLPLKGTRVFQNLKRLIVRQCDSLKYLLTPTITIMLVNLEEICVEDNELMEAIIGREETNVPNDGDEMLLGTLVLPKLKSLAVKTLPNLRKLCCSPDLILELPSLSHLDTTFMVEDILTIGQICRLTTLSIGEIGVRRYALSPPLAEQLVCIQELTLRDGELMEAIIGRDKSDGEYATKSSIVFPELRKLNIINLPSFRSLSLSTDLNLELPSLTELQIYSTPIDIFTREIHLLQNLTTLKVVRCTTEGQNYLLTSSSAEVLVHLEELHLASSNSMEAIFGSENSDREKIPTKTIVLPKLRKLELRSLPNFRMLCCSLNVDVNLHSLTELIFDRCPKMSKLCDGELSAPQLKNVRYGIEVAIGTFTNSWLKDCESMIRCLDCRCKSYTTCRHLADQNSESQAKFVEENNGIQREETIFDLDFTDEE